MGCVVVVVFIVVRSRREEEGSRWRKWGFTIISLVLACGILAAALYD
jgi:hypothetical protein